MSKPNQSKSHLLLQRILCFKRFLDTFSNTVQSEEEKYIKVVSEISSEGDNDNLLVSFVLSKSVKDKRKDQVVSFQYKLDSIVEIKFSFRMNRDQYYKTGFPYFKKIPWVRIGFYVEHAPSWDTYFPGAGFSKVKEDGFYLSYTPRGKWICSYQINIGEQCHSRVLVGDNYTTDAKDYSYIPYWSGCGSCPGTEHLEKVGSPYSWIRKPWGDRVGDYYDVFRLPFSPYIEK